MGFFKTAAKATIITKIVQRMFGRRSRRLSASSLPFNYGRSGMFGRRSRRIAASALPFAYGNAALGGIALYAFNKYRENKAAMRPPDLHS